MRRTQAPCVFQPGRPGGNESTTACQPGFDWVGFRLESRRRSAGILHFLQKRNESGPDSAPKAIRLSEFTTRKTFSNCRWGVASSLRWLFVFRFSVKRCVGSSESNGSSRKVPGSASKAVSISKPVTVAGSLFLGAPVTAQSAASREARRRAGSRRFRVSWSAAGLGGVARRGGVPPRRLRPGVAASPLAGKRVHGAGSFAPSAGAAWVAGAAGAFVAGFQYKTEGSAGS